MLRAYVVCMSLLALCVVQVEAVRSHGEFVGMKLVLDANPGEGNDGLKTLAIPEVGETISVQFFVPSAGGKQVLGYTIRFELMFYHLGVGGLLPDPGRYGDLKLQGGTDWGGTSLTVGADSPRQLTALLVGKPRVPASGFLGTANFLVQGNLRGLFLVASATMADVITGDSDVLESSEAIVEFIEVVEPIPGDLDLDGDVDFRDFLTFAENFGRSGPVPTSGGTSTRVVTVTETIRDTVYIGSDESPRRQRAENLLGFWTFEVPGIDTSFDFLFGHLGEPDHENLGGEIIVFGVDAGGVIAGGYFDRDLEQYVVIHSRQREQYGFAFDIEGNRAVGEVGRWVYTNESVEELGSLGSDSGRNLGESFVFYEPPNAASKATMTTHDVDTLCRGFCAL